MTRSAARLRPRPEVAVGIAPRQSGRPRAGRPASRRGCNSQHRDTPFERGG